MPVTTKILRERLSLRDRPVLAPEGLWPAGVLVPVLEGEEGPSLLFTQRTMTVRDHQGQISFPGGVQDQGDPSLLHTALRETREEIGLDPEDTEILGDLPPLTTVTGYFIHPFVALIPYPYDFRLNPREVKQLFIFSLAELAMPGRWSTGHYTFKGQTIRVYCWKHGEVVIWGATAGIVLELLSRLDLLPLPFRPE